MKSLIALSLYTFFSIILVAFVYALYLRHRVRADWREGQAKSRRPKNVAVLFGALLLAAGCGGNMFRPTGSSAALLPGERLMTAQELDYYVGTWSAPQTITTRGEPGALRVVFGPTTPPNLSSTVTWISSRTSLEYHGTSTGVVGADGVMRVTITADQANPVGATTCGYSATAVMSADHNHILVTYRGDGPGVCGEKAGTADMVRLGNPPQEPLPQCDGHDKYTWASREWLAHYPDLFDGFRYPNERGPYPFMIPAGTWSIVAVTGDNHSEKPDEIVACANHPETCQKGEMLKYAFPDGQVTGPTGDVPEDQDEHATNLGVMTFAAPVTSFRVLHAGPLPVTLPTDSVYPVSLSYACPTR